MINDNTIDEKNAQYWCMFMDKKLASILDDAMQYDAKDGKRLAEIAAKVKNSKQFAEALDEGIWDTAQIMHQTAFPMATGNPFQPNFRGLDSASGVPSLQDQQKNNVIAGATAAALTGITAIPGAWTVLGSALAAGLGATGSWLATTAASTAASIGTGGIMAIVGGIVSVSTYLYPRIAKLINDFRRNSIIAKCNFEADGQPYQAVFSLSNKKWELVFTNNRWIRTGTNVPKSDIAAFFNTEFFKRFLKQCNSYVSQIYDDADRLQCLKTLANMSNDSKEVLLKIVNAKSTITDYMLTGKYET